MTYRANWFWQIKVTTVTSCLTGSKAVVELPLYQAGVQPGIRERLIGMFIKNAISLKIYFSNSKIIAVSLPGMKRRLSIFMPLFHLPVFWFGYFDGFKTLSRLSAKIVCHETPARFLWILPAAMGAVAGALPKDCTALWGLILVGMLQLCYNKRKLQLIWGVSAPRICREESCNTNPTKRTLSPHRKIPHKMLPHLLLRRPPKASRRANGSRKYRLSIKSVQFRLL